MVKITEDGFAVECKTAQPGNDYVQTFNEMISLMQSADPEMHNDENYFHLFELMKSMVPSAQQAKLIFEDEEKQVELD